MENSITAVTEPGATRHHSLVLYITRDK